MRSGRRLAFDFGTKRIGVAVSDFHGILASPIEFIANAQDALITSVRALVNEYEPIEIYVGLPIGLSGISTASTNNAVAFAQDLAKEFQIPVRFIDERLTTNLASAALQQAGKNSRQAKSTIDSASAAVILEQALQLEKQGEIPGIAVGEY